MSEEKQLRLQPCYFSFALQTPSMMLPVGRATGTEDLWGVNVCLEEARLEGRGVLLIICPIGSTGGIGGRVPQKRKDADLHWLLMQTRLWDHWVSKKQIYRGFPCSSAEKPSGPRGGAA